MAWIPAKSEVTMHIRAPLAAVFRFLTDVERSGRKFPGVETIERRPDGFHWVLAERSTAGLKFKADYVVRYRDNGTNEISWTPVSGNLRSSGRWRMTPTPDGVNVTLTAESEADVKVPRLLAAIARTFAQREHDQGVAGYVAAIKRALEPPPRRPAAEAT